MNEKSPHPELPDLSYLNRSAVLNDQQFTSKDVCTVTNINSKQLEHVLDAERSILRLSTHQRDKIKGKRLLFSGDDILKIHVLFVSNAIGFPQRWAQILADYVSRRAKNRLIGFDITPNLHLATYPGSNDDWIFTPLHDNLHPEPKFPLGFQIIKIDLLIDQTLEKLHAIVDGIEIPDFSFPEPPKEQNLYSVENDFFMMWDKDLEGRDVRVGLTYEETSEVISLEDVRHKSASQSDRYLALFQKHEGARLDRLSETCDERLKAALKGVSK